MNAKIAVFVIFVEAITYLLLYNLHGSTFQLFVKFYRQTMVLKRASTQRLCSW